MLRLFQHILCFLEEDPSLVEIPQELSFVNEVFSDSMHWELGKMFASLILLLGIFGLGCWLFRRFLRSRGHIPSSNSSIKVLDRRVLPSKTSIYVIKVANKTIVIAERGEHVTLLSEFPPNTDLNELMQQDQKKTPTPRREMLSGFLNQFKDKK
ncbi:flagellar biosynthetic protein FliO [Chlamydia muridarum str. Nigg]|jgi:Flagellar biogenesis protein|uniref:Flagellar protein n=2 Tax=Chlamydia muridarum TaxID=83560 RepID=A0A069ZYT2_CHLMR|nr:FliO/MopB family protein [Chlamydia muridarum]UFT40116.1 FliO/MopB family protein [Chlamydia trachomatis]AAF39236.1 conserved hypothetical protein [Chlamydia muridarum str. Nigg]AHH22764.1 hypothetical protein TAC_01955 [Chlamydia muridarum str. Nigg3 CMUT3-5]AHH23689.1 hypothetical protein Y015_01955 [Chlamydia muridarum str. Nigg CM972]AID37903.1 hypothetical protein BB17_01995 [Chlamydia muridarum str. Nigg 2 MCR]